MQPVESPIREPTESCKFENCTYFSQNVCSIKRESKVVEVALKVLAFIGYVFLSIVTLLALPIRDLIITCKNRKNGNHKTSEKEEDQNVLSLTKKETNASVIIIKMNVSDEKQKNGNHKTSEKEEDQHASSLTKKKTNSSVIIKKMDVSELLKGFLISGLLTDSPIYSKICNLEHKQNIVQVALKSVYYTTLALPIIDVYINIKNQINRNQMKKGMSLRFLTLEAIALFQLAKAQAHLGNIVEAKKIYAIAASVIKDSILDEVISCLAFIILFPISLFMYKDLFKIELVKNKKKAHRAIFVKPEGKPRDKKKLDKVLAAAKTELSKLSKENSMEYRKLKHLFKIVKAHAQCGNIVEAKKVYKNLKEIRDNIDSGYYKAKALCKSVKAEVALGNRKDAVEILKRAKEHAEKYKSWTDKKYWKVDLLCKIVKAEVALGNIEEAVGTLKRAKAIAMNIFIPEYKAELLFRIAAKQVALNDIESAKQTYKDAHDIAFVFKYENK